MSDQKHILVLYYSIGGTTRSLAMEAATGIEAAGMEARVRTVPKVVPVGVSAEYTESDDDAPLCEKSDLADCAGLVMGSPTRFGNMAAPLKYFLDGTGDLWGTGALAGKPAGVLCSTNSLHGGHETTAVSMMFPLLHHGMLMVGVPYVGGDLGRTQGGGSPYGAGTVTGTNETAPDEVERKIARTLGTRVARVATQLLTHPTR